MELSEEQLSKIRRAREFITRVRKSQSAATASTSSSASNDSQSDSQVVILPKFMTSQISAHLSSLPSESGAGDSSDLSSCEWTWSDFALDWLQEIQKPGHNMKDELDQMLRQHEIDPTEFCDDRLPPADTHELESAPHTNCQSPTDESQPPQSSNNNPMKRAASEGEHCSDDEEHRVQTKKQKQSQDGDGDEEVVDMGLVHHGEAPEEREGVESASVEHTPQEKSESIGGPLSGGQGSVVSFEERRKKRREKEAVLAKFFKGRVVITPHNGMVYAVDRVDLSQNACSTFDPSVTPSYVDYYFNKYSGLQIKDPTQPLLRAVFLHTKLGAIIKDQKPAANPPTSQMEVEKPAAASVGDTDLPAISATTAAAMSSASGSGTAPIGDQNGEVPSASSESLENTFCGGDMHDRWPEKDSDQQEQQQEEEQVSVASTAKPVVPSEPAKKKAGQSSRRKDTALRLVPELCHALPLGFDLVQFFRLGEMVIPYAVVGMRHQEKLNAFLSKVGIPKFNNPLLLRQAFTTSAFAMRWQQTGNYERLEILGDSVLGLTVCEALFRDYPMADEGVLTALKSAIVANGFIGKVADNLGFSDCALSTDNETNLGTKWKADMFEAFVGALFIDQGLATAMTFVQKFLLDAHKSFCDKWVFTKSAKLLLPEHAYAQETRQNMMRSLHEVDMQKLAKAEEALGHTFADKSLLLEALITPACSQFMESQHFNYQRLEFLGDAILKFIVMSFLYSNWDLPPGPLSICLHQYVDYISCSEACESLGLKPCVFLAQGQSLEYKMERYKRIATKNVLCDVFEATLAAIYLDSAARRGGTPGCALVFGQDGWANKHIEADIHTQSVHAHLIRKKLEEGKTPATIQHLVKGRLLEMVQALFKVGNVFQDGVVPAELDADAEPGEKWFCRTVTIKGITISHGLGEAKRVAEDAASERALAILAELFSGGGSSSDGVSSVETNFAILRRAILCSTPASTDCAEDVMEEDEKSDRVEGEAAQTVVVTVESSKQRKGSGAATMSADSASRNDAPKPAPPPKTSASSQNGAMSKVGIAPKLTVDHYLDFLIDPASVGLEPDSQIPSHFNSKGFMQTFFTKYCNGAVTIKNEPIGSGETGLYIQGQLVSTARAPKKIEAEKLAADKFLRACAVDMKTMIKQFHANGGAKMDLDPIVEKLVAIARSSGTVDPRFSDLCSVVLQHQPPTTTTTPESSSAQAQKAPVQTAPPSRPPPSELARAMGYADDGSVIYAPLPPPPPAGGDSVAQPPTPATVTTTSGESVSGNKGGSGGGSGKSGLPVFSAFPPVEIDASMRGELDSAKGDLQTWIVRCFGKNPSYFGYQVNSGDTPGWLSEVYLGHHLVSCAFSIGKKMDAEKLAAHRLLKVCRDMQEKHSELLRVKDTEKVKLYILSGCKARELVLKEVAERYWHGPDSEKRQSVEYIFS